MDSFKDVNVNASLEEAKKLIGERKFINADEVLERVLFSDRENSEAYLLKLVIDLQLTSVDELKDQLEPLESRINYQRAYEFADEKQRAKLNKINEEIKKNAGQADLARQYNLAMNYKSDGRYQEAEQVFNQILEYKDAKAQAAECLKQVQSSIYQKAIDAKQSRDYDEAISLFEKIIDYSDSKAQLKECRDTIAASTYERAMQLKEEKHYDRAIPYFQKISGYKDADEQVKACERLQEEARQEAIYVTCLFTGEIDPYKHASKLKESCTKLATIPGYKDADQLLAKYQNILDEYEKELERKREEKAKARAKAKKKAKKVAIFTAIGAALITAGLLLTFLYFVPENRQTTWQKRVNDASTKDDYQQIIDEIGTNDYGDSTNLVAMAKAGQEFEAGRYESGIDYIYNIGGSVDVEYDGNGGTPAKGTETIKKTTSQAYIENTSSKKGYNENCRWVLTEYDLNASKHYASLKLKADYDLKPDKIIYDLKGGTKASNSPNQYDYEHATKIPNPTRTGYTFLGWTVNNESGLKVDYTIPINNAGEWNLTANWEANKYTVNISDLNGGTAAKTSYEVTYDGSYSIPAPTRVGYTFVRFVVVKDGKETTETVPTSGTWTYPSNYSLKAIWSARTDITYTVKHYQEPVAGGNYSDYVLTDTDQKRGTADAEVLISTLTKNYTGFEYKDVANNNNTNKTKITVKPDGSLSVDLYYSRRSYTLSFAGNGGDIKNGTETVSSPITLKYGAQIPNTITVSREGSTFGGWYTDAGQATKFTTMPAQNTTVYAYYSEETKASSFVYQETNASIKITGNNGLTGAVVVPQYINNKPVTEIGDNAFKNNTGIASIVLPENVTKIGASAFEGCNVLTAGPDLSNIVTIGNNAFKDCTSMTTITLGEPLSSIGNYAFANCASLLQLPDISGVTTIGNHAFDGCANLSEIKGLNGCATFGEGILTACENLAKLTISFKEVVEQFYIARLFSNNSTISNTDKYYLPDNYSSYLVPKALKTIEYTGGEQIPAYLLFGLSYVETFIDNSTSTVGVGDYAFYSCSALTDPLDLTNVTSIGEYAFSGVLAFTSITLSDSLTSIGQGAFSGCSNVTTLSVPFLGSDETNANDLGYIFGKTNYTGSYSATQKNGTYYLPSSLTSLTIKGGIITEKAIANASKLTKIVIGDSVTSIDDTALSGCSALEDLTIPEFFEKPEVADYTYTGDWTLNNKTFSYSGYGTAYKEETITFNKKGTAALSYNVNSTSYIYCYILKNGSQIDYAYGSTSTRNYSVSVSKGDILVFRFYNSTSSSSRTANVTMNFTSSEDYSFARIFGTTSYNGSYADSTDALKHYIPSTLTTITVTKQKTIPDQAFKGYSSLSRVNVPTDITKIGDYAFYGCSKLTSLNETGSISIPATVKSIGDYAFYNDSLISAVSIANNSSLESIGDYAFYNLPLLSKWGSDTSGTLNIPNGTESIGVSAFENAKLIKKVVVADSVTSIGSFVFAGCSSLEDLTIPEFYTPTVLPDANEVSCYEYSGSWSKNGDTFSYSNNGSRTVDETITFTFSGKVNLSYYVSATNYITLTILMNGNQLYSISGNTATQTATFDVEKTDTLTFRFYNSTSSYSRTAYVTMTFTPTPVESFWNIFGNKSYQGSYPVTEQGLTNYIPDSLENVTIAKETVIPQNAFKGLSSLISVTIPEDTASIGEAAFYGCTNLISLNGDNVINIPSGVTRIEKDTFALDSSIANVSFGNVTFIGESAFKSNSSLTSLEFPTSLKTIGKKAFYGVLVTSLELPDALETIGESAFENCSTLVDIKAGDSSSLTTIGNKVFKDCSSLLQIPTLSNVTSIGDYAFANCDLLTNVSGLAKVQTIGNYAFSGCESLGDIVDFAALILIGNYAFSGCDALVNVSFPDTLLSIGDYAFANCENLANVKSFNNVQTIGQYAFCNDVSLLTVPSSESIQEIGQYAFSNCSLLTTATVNGNATVGKGAFSKCSALTSASLAFDSSYTFYDYFGSATSFTSSVDKVAYNGDTYFIPSGLVTLELKATNGTIAAGALYNCNQITTLTINSSVKSIGSKALYNCSGLTKLSIPDTVTSMGSNSLEKCINLEELRVPFVGTAPTSGSAFGVIFGSTTSNGLYSAVQNGNTYYLPSALTKLTIGGGSIAANACANMTKINDLTLGDLVLSVADGAFAGCTSIATLKAASLSASTSSTGFNYSGSWSKSNNQFSYSGYGSQDETITFTASGAVHLSYYVSSTTYITLTILKNGSQICSITGSTATQISTFKVDKNDKVVFRFYNSNSSNSRSAYVTMTFKNTNISGELAHIFGTNTPAGTYGASNGSTTYYVPSSLKIVTLTSKEISNSAFRNCTSLTKVTIPDDATSIGAYAFYNCTGLASLNGTNAFNIPESVITIGSYAFAECKSAATVVVGGSAVAIGEYAFQNCTLISSLTLSKGITSIGNYAFYNNISLTTLNVPASVTSVGNYAFYGASSLTKVNIEDKSLLNNLGQFSFANCTALTEFLFDGTSSLQTIGNSAFSDSSLVAKWGKDENDTITIPSGTTSIGSSAFANMPIITKVRIADTVTTVGSGAFSGCSSVKDLTTPSIFGSTSPTGYNYSGSWTKSGDTFSYNSSGTTTVNETITFTSSGKVDLQYSVSSTSYVTCFISKNGVQIYSVTGTTTVQKATINVAKNDTLTFSWKCSTSGSTRKATVYMTFTCAKAGNLGYIFGTANYGGSYQVYDGYSYNYYIPVSLKTVSVTKEDVPCYAFNNCTFLTKVVLPDETTAINDYAFYNCTGLKSLNGDNEIIIPASVESIGYSAFEGSSAITKITIEDESLLESILNRAFTSCSALKSFNFEGSSSLKTIGAYAFSGSSLLEKWGSDVSGAIEVPEGTETIGTYAFANLPIITSIDVADSVEYVGDYAFSGCSSLICLEMPKIYSTVQGNGYTYSGVWNYNGNYFYYTGTGTSYREETITFSSNGQVSLEYYVSSTSYIYCYIYKNGSQLGSYAYGTTSHYYNNNVSVAKNDYLTFRFYNTSSSTSRTAYVYLTYTPTIEYSFGRLFSANNNGGVYSNTDSHGTHYIPLSLTTVSITTGDLPANAFKGFTSLTRVNIPENSITIGASAFYGCTNLASINKESQINIPDSIKTIGENAFYGCTSIASVLIGEEGATTIGASAFYGCTSLTTASIGGEGTTIGASAFDGCSALTTLTLKEGVKTIGNSAFSGASSLLAINIPASITSIGNSAFRNASSLTKATIADKSLLGTIGESAFHNSGLVEFKFSGSSSLETISDYAFYNCNNLSKWGTDDAGKVLIPEGTLTIGSNAFAYSNYITDIIVADSVTDVGVEAFKGCKSLVNLTMPKVFGTIHENEKCYTYSGAWNTTTISNTSTEFYYGGTGTTNRDQSITFKVGGSVNLEYYVSNTNYVSCLIGINGQGYSSVSGTTAHSVENIVVSKGDVLKLTFKNTSASYSRNATVMMSFSPTSTLGTLFGTTLYEDAYLDTESTIRHYIPNSLKTVTITTENIPLKAFYGFKSLTRVNVPNDIDSIEPYAFYNCTALKGINSDSTIDIPASIESIGKYAFNGCTAITTVSIGNGNGMTIGEFAFNNCSSLVTVTTGDNITEIGSSAFKDCVLLAKINSNVAGYAVLPNGLVTVQTYAFKNCDLLTDVTFGPNITTLALSSFNGCTNIAKATFSFDGNGWNSNPSLATVFADSISNLTEIVVSAGKEIPAYMFENMSNIEKVTLPETVEKIKSYAFSGCTGLTKINSNETGKAILPNSLTRICLYAFSGCTGLTDITTGNQLDTIENAAFQGCSNIVRFNSNTDGHMVLPASCKTLAPNCFYGMTGITDLTINDQIATIESGAFGAMNSLVNITLPFVGTNIKAASGSYLAPFGSVFGYVTTSTSTNSIDGYIYSGLTISSQKYWYHVPESLRTVKITVQTQIPAYAFYNCSMLTNIYTPNSVTSTGSYAYTNCPATVTNNVVPVISSPWNGATAASFHSGDGSQANPYVIFDGNELKFLAYQVNNGTSYENKYFVLTCDIDLNSLAFPTIGDDTHPFLGNINGHGHYIKNIKIAGTTKYVGMFGYLGGTLEHLGFFGGTITSTVSGNDNYYVGLVAYLTSTGSISNVYSDVTVSISDAFYEYAGGIAGYVDGGSIINCFSKGNISANNTNLFAYVGGIAGYLNAGSINGCYSYGNITANGSATIYSRNGQIVGDKADNTTVVNCYKYSGATLIRYSVSGSVYNTDGAAFTEDKCLAAVKSFWDNTKWKFTGNVPALKTI